MTKALVKKNKSKNVF